MSRTPMQRLPQTRQPLLDRILSGQANRDAARTILVRAICERRAGLEALFNLGRDASTLRFIVSRDAQHLLIDHESNRYVTANPSTTFMGVHLVVDDTMRGVDYDVAVVLP